LTRSKAETPSGTGLWPTGDALRRITVFQAQVTKLELCFSVIALTQDNRCLPGHNYCFNTQNAGQLCYQLRASRGTQVGLSFSSDQGFGISSTAGKPTGAAVDAGQNFHCSQLARIDLNSEFLCCNAERNGGDHTDASETQYRCKHLINP
jgi:hypothetical protein